MKIRKDAGFIQVEALMKENQVEKEVIVEEEKETICWALLELQSSRNNWFAWKPPQGGFFVSSTEDLSLKRGGRLFYLKWYVVSGKW